MLAPSDIPELQECLRDHPRLTALGGGTKAPLGQAPGFETVSTRDLSGIIEYEPSEFTFTALAGTPLAEVEARLAEHSQYLPFDPLLAEQGATLGGTVAAAAAGPGRLRYGGVRDFLIGIRYVDAAGTLVQGGGKVVKNAAGFDLPKLMTGALGRLGILAELSFKVFPRPETTWTGCLPAAGAIEACETVAFMNRLPAEFEAVDFSGDADRIWFRIAGSESAMAARIAAIESEVKRPVERPAPETAGDFWRRRLALDWIDDATVVKVPLTLRQIPAIEERIASAHPCERHYSVGGNVAYLVSIRPDLEKLHRDLDSLGLTGLVFRGPVPSAEPRLGRIPGRSMEAHIKSVLDPRGAFPAFNS